MNGLKKNIQSKTSKEQSTRKIDQTNTKSQTENVKKPVFVIAITYTYLWHLGIYIVPCVYPLLTADALTHTYNSGLEEELSILGLVHSLLLFTLAFGSLTTLGDEALVNSVYRPSLKPYTDYT